MNPQANVEGWNPSETDENSGIGARGACCPEMDLWEANSMSFALTPHPCRTNEYFVCETTDCGGTYSEDRYAGDCDPDGCDLNPFRHGNTDFYGPGKTIDTKRKFTVVTQFNGGSTLNSISQYFVQDGVRFDVPGSQYVDGGSEIDAEYCGKPSCTMCTNVYLLTQRQTPPRRPLTTATSSLMSAAGRS